MIDDELLAKFDRIQDLPVSEEMLGAFAEGTLHGAELDDVAEQISSESSLSAMLEEISNANVDDLVELEHPWDIYEDDYGYWELGLPPVLYPSDMENKETEIIADEKFVTDRNLTEATLSLQNAENSLGDNPSNIDNMATSSKTIIYGEAGENISDPVFIQQPDDHSCALRSQQIVLRDFGIDIPFKDLEQIALDYNIYTNEGTYTYDIGKVLHLAGVDMHQTVGNSVDDLINELAQGHRVIVSVDANELWYNETVGQKLKNWFEDAIGHQGGNHALIVAGVEVDSEHPENSKVILTDPGAGHLRIEYPMEQFKDAWGDSSCFMAATNNPAPYQYDVATGYEIPSNFAVQQYVNEFVANNSYQLSPDMINVPQDYQPAFMGHVDVVGDVDYETFKSDYDAMVAQRIPSSLSVKEQIEESVKLHEEQNAIRDNGFESQSNQPSETQSKDSNEYNQGQEETRLHNEEYPHDNEDGYCDGGVIGSWGDSPTDYESEEPEEDEPEEDEDDNFGE